MKSRQLALALAISIGFTLSACTSPAANDAASSTASPSATASSAPVIPDEESPAPSPSPTGLRYGVGDTIAHGSIQMTLVESSEAATLPNSDWKGNTEVQPEADGKFVIVKTHIKNIGSESMDLTCGYPIAIKGFTVDERTYDPVEDLYKIPGNPECNDKVQPGFERDMTYAFMIPANSTLAAIYFTEGYNYNDNDPSVFQLTDDWTVR